MLSLLFLNTTAMAQDHRLHGHVPPDVAKLNLQSTGRLPATNQMRLAIGLPLRDQAGLDALLQQLYDPASPNYRHYLTPGEFTERFGPTQQDYDKVIAFANKNGLQVAARYSTRMVVDVTGAAQDVEKAFHLTMRTYKHPTENRDFFAPDVEPTVASDLPIADISGLNNETLPHPKNLHRTPLRASAKSGSKNGSGPGGTFLGNDLRAAYVPGVTLTGTGQSVGLFEFDGFYANDITSFQGITGLTVPVQTVLVDGFSGTPTTGANSGNGEVALDIEVAMSVAPGLSSIVVFEGPPGGSANDVLTVMSTNTGIKQFSCSWDFASTNPRGTMDGLFQQFMAQGQSFYDASGDHGAYSGAIPQPDDDPFITIVGGTTLATSASGGSWLGEIVWNVYGGEASAGGISTTYSNQTWEAGISTPANHGSATNRIVPDVAMVAENIFVVADNGQEEIFGGTSVAAPAWAAFTALVNQQAVAAGKPVVGFVNPAIYAIGKSAAYAATFNDITVGTNGNATHFPAVPGFDLCTGWGSPAGGSLIIALADPDGFLIAPARGLAPNGPAGGPFNVSTQNFSLTNTGAASLTWSVNTIAPWLNVSSAGGVLPAGGATNVTVSLTPAASTMAVGVYTADVWFTNLTSGLAQDRQFTLQVGQELVQEGGFETGDFAYWMFSGNPTDDFVDDGSSTSPSAPHSGQFFAALGNLSTLGFLSQTIPTRVGQPYLVSFWLENATGDTPNQFVAEWNSNSVSTNMIFNQSNSGAFAYTDMQFIETAASANTILQFGFRDDPDFLGLDDVSVVPIPVPALQNISAAGGVISFTWNTLPGLVYQVQFTTSISPTAWTNLGVATTAGTTTMNASDTIGANQQRFYRVVVSL